MDHKVSLSVEGLRFGYDRKSEVLHGISFEVNRGDLLFLLGPNGSGKTTLFKCLLGLYRPRAGRILVEGEDIHAISATALAKKMAYIPQAHNPSFNYTVTDAVLMGRTAYLKGNSAPGPEDREVAAAAMEKLGISHLADKGYAHISGGERQMVLIARALAQQSRVIVMDEPTSSLDYGHQVTVLSVVKKLAEEGYTVIISSHNPEHAFLYANKVLLMKRGSILTMGAPREVVDRQILEGMYGVPMDLVDVRREGEGQQVYRVCVPVL